MKDNMRGTITILGIFVVKVRENLLISSCALPGSGRENGKKHHKLTDYNYADPKPDHHLRDADWVNFDFGYSNLVR